jgi:cephalosporin-C deacetylase-like acetyl esterase
MLLGAPATHAQHLRATPYRQDGTYAVDETVGWRLAPSGGQAIEGRFTYVVRRNGGTPVDSGAFELGDGAARIETSLFEPGMVLVEVRPPEGTSDFGGESRAEVGRMLLGAAVAPREIRPVGPRPDDFDAFWAEKIEELARIPMVPRVTPGESGVEGVEYAQLRLDHVEGAHVWAQMAWPAGGDRLPALVLFQWASPPYPLQRTWVTDRAAEGWLVVNVQPHDVPPDLPQAFYDALPERIKRYDRIGRANRDESYFLDMYLGDYRALEYVTSRPDWDGRTLVVMGTSMGGQQSLAMAGLHRAVSALLVNVPSGGDVAGPLQGRQPAYPRWEADRPAVLEAAAYFDPANFAPRIRARALVSVGFIDETSPPASIWAMFNTLQGQKEVVPMVTAPHNHLSTPTQVAAWERRSAAWLEALARGAPPGSDSTTNDSTTGTGATRAVPSTRVMRRPR